MNDEGSIINIISIAAHRPSPGFGVYSANMGMISMTRTLAIELAPRKITVNCAPGVVVTEMLRETMNVTDEQAKQIFDQVIPLGDWNSKALRRTSFASPAGRWIQGQFIDVAVCPT